MNSYAIAEQLEKRWRIPKWILTALIGISSFACGLTAAIVFTGLAKLMDGGPNSALGPLIVGLVFLGATYPLQIMYWSFKGADEWIGFFIALGLGLYALIAAFFGLRNGIYGSMGALSSACATIVLAGIIRFWVAHIHATTGATASGPSNSL